MTTFAQACEKIRKDKATSFWLKNQIAFLLDRDPVDALNDCATLTSLMQLRCQDLGLEGLSLAARRYTFTDEDGVVLETDGEFVAQDEGITSEEKAVIARLVVNGECKIGGGAAPLLTVRRVS